METSTQRAGRLTGSIKRQQVSRVARSSVRRGCAMAAKSSRSRGRGRRNWWSMKQRIERYSVVLEVFERQIDAVARCVLGDVAQNVGQLEGNSGLLRQLFSAQIAVAEDADADQTDDRGDEIAVAVEIGEGFVGLGSAGGSVVKSRVTPATSSSSSESGIAKRCVASRTARNTGSMVAAPFEPRARRPAMHPDGAGAPRAGGSRRRPDRRPGA